MVGMNSCMRKMNESEKKKPSNIHSDFPFINIRRNTLVIFTAFVIKSSGKIRWWLMSRQSRCAVWRWPITLTRQKLPWHRGTEYESIYSPLENVCEILNITIGDSLNPYLHNLQIKRELTSRMKRVWHFVKSKWKERTGVVTPKVNGNSISNLKDMAGEFNKQLDTGFTHQWSATRYTSTV